MTGEVNLGGKRPDRAEWLRVERDQYAAEVERAAQGFPMYEVPEFVRERFPEFDPADPSTWPEPDRCTEGRPWGFAAYGAPGPVNPADRWRRYLAALVNEERTGRRPSYDRGCRNRWKHDDSRLCGTHDKPWREGVESARRRLARNARELEHLDLAKQLGRFGIEADGFSDSIRLQADAARALLAILAEYLEPDPPREEFPTTDLTVPPPL